ncbi:PepSY-associated TM helix domain-containing protein [Confluentibacter sediminis]|uniref:PepSY-associated TM helix domain-containing protein n=1 Tax=Confluentibacter sediminis TaxID=2219045 RepID=UPI000DACA00B|nr:PepSY-associated TM helix domain-containing protein [Confluentibacter sediminis]
MHLNKKSFFRIHGWIGIKLSILFFIVCFSGTMATLSHEMDWLFNPDIRAKAQDTYAPKDVIVENLKTQFPEGDMTLWLAAEAPYLCDIIYVTDKGQQWYVFANPYTGVVQGATKLTIQRFFRDLHYYLFTPQYQIGYFIVLLFAFMLFISMGTALFFYKDWYKKLFELKRGKGRVFFFRSLHRLVGVWSVPFCILFSMTGMWYFVERTNIADVGTIANPAIPKTESLKAAGKAAKINAYTIDYDKAVSKAEAAISGLEVKDIYPPKNAHGSIYLTGISDVKLVRNRANRIYIHPETYEVIGVQRADALNTKTWINDIIDPLHFGTWGGLLTKIIWFFAGLCISSLVLTGIWISLKRKVKKKEQQKRQQMGGWKYINGALVGGALCFMYYKLIYQYGISTRALGIITCGWAVIISMGWYLFVYRLHKK